MKYYIGYTYKNLFLEIVYIYYCVFNVFSNGIL